MEFKKLPFCRHLTPNLALCLFLMSISVFNFGMENTVYSTVQAMDRMSYSSCINKKSMQNQLTPSPAFIDRFGTVNPKTGKHVITARNLSFLTSLPRITFAAGIVLGGFIAERVGRRPVIFLMMVICLVGAIVSYTATTYAQILIGRMLVNGYVGMEGFVVPMFQAEITPAAIRGAVVISYLFNHVFGSFIMSCVTYKTANLDSDLCWKIPVALLLIIPAIVLLASWLLPESPRWLVRKGKDEEALKQLKYLYGSDAEFEPERELKLLKERLEAERQVEQARWMDLFRGTNLVSYSL